MNLNVWSKTLNDGGFYPLVSHLLDSALMAGLLFDYWLRPGLQEKLAISFGGREEAKKGIQLAAGLHDLGKCSPIFQGQLLGRRTQAEGEKFKLKVKQLEAEGLPFPVLPSDDRVTGTAARLRRHEKLGTFSLTSEDPTGFIDEQADENWLPLAILGHHGLFTLDYGISRRGKSPQVDFLNALFSEEWLKEQRLTIEKIEEFVGAKLTDVSGVVLEPNLIVIVSGLVILADRLASNSDIVEQNALKLKEGSLSIDPLSYDRCEEDFLRHIKREIGLPVEVSEQQILPPGSTKRGVQKTVPTGDGLWFAMAPTGSGKTEAALLRHAQRKENLIFLLPTQSTTTAMFKRVKRVFNETQETIVSSFAHGTAFLDDFYASGQSWNNYDCGLIPTHFTKNGGAKLSASINIATIDQLLMAGLPLKWTHLRLLILANSHVVIDEAHLLDPYQLQLSKDVLYWLGSMNSRVTVLSATLPSWVKKSLEESYISGSSSPASYPASFYKDKEGSSLTPVESDSYEVAYELVNSESPKETHVTWAKEQLNAFPKARLGIFVNKVALAQEIAKELRDQLPGDAKIICFHSRMLTGHKEEILQTLLREIGTKIGKGERFILVGTQVIEMSLDIDLDLVSTDLCPAPNLIQRLGRQMRDRKDQERWKRIPQETQQTVQIVVPSNLEEKRAASYPYAEGTMRRTKTYLSEKATHSLSFPLDLQSFVETSHIDEVPEDLEENIEKSFLQEKAEEFFRIMRGEDNRIKLEDTLDTYATVGDFSELTRSTASELDGARFVERNEEPFILKSDDPQLLKWGAIRSNFPVTKTSLTPAITLKASINTSYGVRKKLEELETPHSPNGWGFISELPEGMGYDKLVGLCEYQ